MKKHNFSCWIIYESVYPIISYYLCVDEINILQALRLCLCKVTVVDLNKYLHEQGMSWAGQMLNKIN